MGYSDLSGHGKLKRIRNAAMMLIPGLLLSWTIGGPAWFILALHAGILVLSLFIVFNNIFIAAIEEYYLSFLMCFPFPLYPMVDTILL